MVNKSRVVSRLAFIEVALKEMIALGSMEKEVFLEDKTKVAAAESFLRRSLEAIFDVGRHILVHEGWHEFSMEYKSIASGMVEKRIVPENLKDKLQQMAGYRNRMVHFYHEITSAELYQIVREDIGDIEEVVKKIKDYIVKKG